MEKTDSYRDPARITISQPTIYNFPFDGSFVTCALCGDRSSGNQHPKAADRCTHGDDHLRWSCDRCGGQWLSETHAQAVARGRMQTINTVITVTKSVATALGLALLVVVLLVAMGMLSGCGGVVGHLPAVSPQQDLIHAYGTTIVGEDCSAVAFGVQTRNTSVQVALDAALSTQQHEVGAVVHDVEIRSIDRGAWIFGERCIRVEGRL